MNVKRTKKKTLTKQGFSFYEAVAINFFILLLDLLDLLIYLLSREVNRIETWHKIIRQIEHQAALMLKIFELLVIRSFPDYIIDLKIHISFNDKVEMEGKILTERVRSFYNIIIIGWSDFM